MNFYKPALAPTVFKNIKDMVFSNSFPWFLTETADLYNSTNPFDYSFSHLIYLKEYKSYSTDIFLTAIACALDNHKINFKDILRIRLGLITPAKEVYRNIPHVDQASFHQTGLIYLNSADGPTIIYNEKFSPNFGKSIQELASQTTFTVLEEVIPEENKMVIFNGFHYHSSSKPTNCPARIVINFNFV